MNVIVLANSYKHENRCIAGIDLATGAWIRPLGSASHGSLYRYEYTCYGRHPAAVLDVVRFDIVARTPAPHQPEDVRTTAPWTFVRNATAADREVVRRAAIEKRELFAGTGDRVRYSEIQAAPVASSLAAVHPQEVIWRNEIYAERMRHRVIFYVAGQRYNLAVTDPLLMSKMDELGEGDHPMDRNGLGLSREAIHLTISLGEPYEYDGCCYKLVAAAYNL